MAHVYRHTRHKKTCEGPSLGGLSGFNWRLAPKKQAEGARQGTSGQRRGKEGRDERRSKGEEDMRASQEGENSREREKGTALVPI